MKIKKQTVSFFMLALVFFSTCEEIRAELRGRDVALVGTSVALITSALVYASNRYECWKTHALLEGNRDIGITLMDNKKIYNWEITRYKYLSSMNKDNQRAKAVKQQLMQDYNSGFISRIYKDDFGADRTGNSISEVLTYAIEELKSYQKQLNPNLFFDYFGPKADFIKICEEYNWDKVASERIKNNPIHWTLEQEGFVMRRLDELCAEYNGINWLFWNYKRTYARYCLIDQRIERLKLLLALVSEIAPSAHNVTIGYAPHEAPPAYTII